MSEILDNIYIWVFLVNIESVLLLALVKYMLCSHFTQNCIFCTFWRLKILVLWQKIVQNLLIFVYLFSSKNSTIDFTKTFIIQKCKSHFSLLTHSLNQSLTPHSLTDSLTHSPTHSLTHSLAHSLTHSLN